MDYGPNDGLVLTAPIHCSGSIGAMTLLSNSDEV